MQQITSEQNQDFTPVFSIGFLICCLIFSVTGLFSNTFFDFFGASRQPENVFQYVTFIFMHGAPGQPAFILIHLLLNGVIIWKVGAIAEKQIGIRHMALISLMAGIGYYLSQHWTGLAVNGASGVIWAYSAVLFDIVHKKEHASDPKGLVDEAKVWLIIMLGVVTLLMGIVPYLFGSKEVLWKAFFYGNIFHFQAVTIGILYLWIIKPNPNK